MKEAGSDRPVVITLDINLNDQANFALKEQKRPSCDCKGNIGGCFDEHPSAFFFFFYLFSSGL